MTTEKQTPAELAAEIKRLTHAYADAKLARYGNLGIPIEALGDPTTASETLDAAINRLAALARAPQGATPAGFVLVPVDPTQEMLDAALEVEVDPCWTSPAKGYRVNGDDIWTAMVNAAPAAPVAPDAMFRDDDPTEAEQVCIQAYQVVGSLLSDLGQFNTERATKILDNLSQQRMAHDDVLPWPSFEKPVAREPLTDAQMEAGCYSYDWGPIPHPFRTSVAFERGVRFAERVHGITPKGST